MPARLIAFLLALSLCACSAGEKPAQPQAAAEWVEDTIRVVGMETIQAEFESRRIKEPMANEDLVEMAKRIKRLPPSAFPYLPVDICNWLEAHCYSIPQYCRAEQPNNVRSGEFYRVGIRDWAVLASRDSESRIIVFHGDTISHKKVDTFLLFPDENDLTVLLNGVVQYERFIYTEQGDRIGKDYVVSSQMVHDGLSTYLNDRHIIIYYDEGNWRVLQHKPFPDPVAEAKKRYYSRFPEEIWDQSVKDIRRLPPSDFMPPPEIEQWLVDRGYTIPQPYYATDAVNVIAGDFCTAGSGDWAVLASKDGVCSIIVFRHGSVSDTLIASVTPERDCLDYIGNGRFGFTRQIENVDLFYGEKYTPMNIDSIFQSTDHQGIGGEKTEPGLLYYDKGTWHSFKGYSDATYVPHGVWLAATESIKRLPPSEFPLMPQNIRAWMEREGYTVPQVYGDDEPHNVISGQFYQAGVKDWALLASKDLKSRLFIFRGGTEIDSSLAGSCDEIGYMQGFGDGILGFSWYISTVDSTYILGQFNSYDRHEEPPFPIEHDGIDDGFLDKASTVLYYHEGEWHELPGAD